MQLPLLESSGIPTNIPRGQIYSTTDAYKHELLGCHDLKLRYQPNAIRDKDDAEGQMAVLTTLRALGSIFTLDHLRHGPFCHIWTDCTDSNIFVNRDYNITSLPDLEWIPVLPMEMLSPPFWLSGYAVDQLEGEKVKHYEEMCAEFVDIFGREDDDTASPLEPR